MPSNRMKRSLTALALTAVAVLAACGDSGTKALSKEEFLKKGNEICTKGNETIDSSASSAFPDSSSSQPSNEQIAQFVTQILAPNVRKQLDEIDKLEPPKDLKSAVDKLLTDARAALTKMEQLAKDDPEAILNSSEDPFADVNKQARDIGLTVCGSDDS